MRVLLIAAAIIVANTAVADDLTARAVESAGFETLDTNADSQISRTEAAAEKALSDSFAFIDLDGDGYVTKGEYEARTRS